MYSKGDFTQYMTRRMNACEMAWNQGLDLYGAVANRLLEGFEYTAQYNLGFDVAFSPDRDKTGKYAHRVISPRGLLRPVYEQIYNHYVHRRKLALPTRSVRQKRCVPREPQTVPITQDSAHCSIHALRMILPFRLIE